MRRAQLFSQGRYAPEYRGPLSLATEDLLLSARSLAPHLKLLDQKTVDPQAIRVASNIVRNWADQAADVADFVSTQKPNGKEFHAS